MRKTDQARDAYTALASQVLQLRTFGDQLFSLCRRRLVSWSEDAH
jgi:hypothetical protein